MHRAYGAQQPALRVMEAIYQAPTEEAGQQALEAFAAAYPQISRGWQANWPNLATFFAYPTDIPQSDLYDECHRVAKQRDPPCDQKA